MVAHALECTSCEQSFRTRTSWLEHLLRGGHHQSRRFILEEDSIRKCAVIVYATFPVATLELLEFFSEGWQLVSDFFGIPDKPRIGIVVLESRKVVKSFFKSRVNGNQQVRIGDQLVEVKKACDCLNLEWADLISSLQDHPRCNEAPQSRQSLNSNPQTCAVKPIKRARGEGLSTSQSHSTVDGLLREYKEICENVELSPSALRHLSEAQKTLKIAMIDNYFPSASLTTFREWGLGFKNIVTAKTPPNIFLDSIDVVKDAKGIEFLRFLKNGKGERSTRFKDAMAGYVTEDDLRFKYMYSYTDFKGRHSYALELYCNHAFVYFAIGQQFLLEAQTDRLLQHLIPFDSRARHLITLMRYCGLVNFVYIRISQICQQNNCEETVPQICSYPNSNPSGIDLLVVLFLCQKKLLPSPREVMAASKQSRVVYGVDIGFDERDSDGLRQEWTKSKLHLPDEGTAEFMLSVLELLHEFFTFLIKLPNSNWILNMKDGEILTVSNNSKSPKASHTALSEPEVVQIKKVLSDARFGCGDNQRMNVVLLHPLLPQACFDFSSGFFQHYEQPAVTLCAVRLSRFLQEFKVAMESGCAPPPDLLKALTLSKTERGNLRCRGPAPTMTNQVKKDPPYFGEDCHFVKVAL